jgi:MHS family proline/betaine transporter-like MFS transporter
MSETGAAGDAADGQVAARRMRCRAIFACLAGSFLEFYDFTLYGFFAISIGRTFFPSISPTISLLSSLATFGAGFLMRPVGGLVMGAYADRLGRKGALIVTMATMALATGIPGLLPGYAQLGLWAPSLLLVCRLAQGFSTGGEWGSAVVFMMEYAEPRRRGFYVSWMQVGVALGSLVGAASALVVSAVLTTTRLQAWGWRIPFIIGFCLLPIGYYLRTRVSETPAFERLVAEKKVTTAPIHDAFRGRKLAMWQVCGTTTIWNAGGYVLLVYLPTFAAQVLKLDLKLALAATTIGTFVRAVLTPAVGLWSDRIGRKPIIQMANVGLLLGTYPLFAWITVDPGATSLVCTAVIAGILLSLISGAGPVMLAELFPTKLRSTLIGIGYNSSVAIFGGFGPFICAYLIHWTQLAIAPAFFLVACSVVSILFVISLKDPKNAPFDEL